MTETEYRNELKELDEWFKLNPTEGEEYKSLKKQLEERFASGNGQAGGQGSSEPLPEDNLGPPPDTAAEDKRREEEEAARRKAEQEAALRKVQQEADARAAKAEADARAAQEKAVAEARARAEAEARTRASQKAAEEEAEARRRAQYTPVPSTPQYNRPSPSYSSSGGNGHSILFGIIGAVAIGIIGSMLGSIICIIIGGIMGWLFGKSIGDSSDIGSGILTMLFFIIVTALLTFTLSDFLTKHDNLLFGFIGLISPLLKILGFCIGIYIIFTLSLLISLISDNFIGKLILIAALIAGGVFFCRPYIAPLFGKTQTVYETTNANGNVTATVTSSVNFRKGPSTDDEIIRQLQQGDTVTLTGETSDGWTQVTYNDDTGWVSSEYINVRKSFFPNIFNLFGKSTANQTTNTNANANGNVTATITSNVNFRKGHSTDDEIIKQLQQGDTVTLTGETSGGWTQITHNGDTGWVSSDFINISEVVE